MPTFKTKFPHMSKGASVSDIALAFDAAMKERAGRAGLQVDGTSRIGDLAAAEIISIRRPMNRSAAKSHSETPRNQLAPRMPNTGYIQDIIAS